MKDIEAKLEHYTQELFGDLGLTDLEEEQKADLFARFEEQMHGIILDELRVQMDDQQKEELHTAIDQGDYKQVDRILSEFPEKRAALLDRIDNELSELKKVIAEEQKHARIE